MGEELHVLLLFVGCEPQRFTIPFALFQRLLGLPQIGTGCFQFGMDSGIFPNSPDHISQAHGHPAFLNREIS